MTPQELKNSILQLAIQGKLVEQRTEEGTAEELYRQIQAEKQTLIQTGKIKKEKPLPEITEEEKLFDIPESWKWVRYSNLFDIGSAIRIHQTDWKTEGIPFFRGRELVRLAKTGDPDAEIFISRELYETNKAKGGVPQKGDLLVTAVGTLGKVYIVQGTHPFYYKDAYILRYNNFSKLFSEYFKYVIESPFIQDYISQGSMGTTVAQLTIEKAKRMICPLPPLAEQKRIVAKIEELLPLIDRYERAWTRLEDFNKRFPTDMQKSLLQLAISGKLVEQRPEEGTGEELYQKIQTEKQSLIRSGKLKKDKPLPEITEDEIPFDIPESWKWVRFASVIDVRDGTHDTPKYVSDGIPLVTSKNLVDGTIDFKTTKNTSLEDATAINLRSRVDDGDILFAMIGTIGNPVLVKKEREFSIKNMALFKPIEASLLDMQYVLLFLRKAQVDMKKIANASVQSFVSLTLLRNYLFPLPPFAEQKRIVAKLESLLPLCSRLQ